GGSEVLLHHRLSGNLVVINTNSMKNTTNRLPRLSRPPRTNRALPSQLATEEKSPARCARTIDRPIWAR
ncbi:hypothetical protein PFISCL1PPCAC_22723, partial [Pristionchus fissidentatus]